MREIISKVDLVTPKSVKFLYDTRIGNVILWVSTRRFVSKIVGTKRTHPIHFFGPISDV